MHDPVHVLVAEDDPTLASLLEDGLQANGFAPAVCTDGTSALDAIEEDEADLYLLDVMLPGVDGFRIAEEVRKRYPDAPIVFLTAKSMKNDRIAGLQLGADDYITKPFHMDELVLRLRAILRRVYGTESAESAVLSLGDIRLEAANQRLNVAGTTVALTYKETEILRVLMESPDTLVTRGDILLRVWGDDDYFMGRTLDVYISKLRKHLRASAGTALTTVHGSGYRLSCTI